MNDLLQYSIMRSLFRNWYIFVSEPYIYPYSFFLSISLVVSCDKDINNRYKAASNNFLFYQSLSSYGMNISHN